MKIKMAGIVNDSIVDGPGFRLAIFVQGCSHHCEGCHNPETHDPNGGTWMETDEILSMAEDNILLDGITLSGGEPFEQPEACAVLAQGAKKLNLSVWSYTGYTFEQLLKGTDAQKALLQNIDILVDGMFILSQKTLDKRFRGSKNQRIIDVPASLQAGAVVLSSLN